MCGPQVRFRERPGGEIPRAYSTVPPTTAAAATPGAGGPEVSAAGDAKPIPDPAVPEKPVRRRFTAEYKLRVLREADACAEPGQLGRDLGLLVGISSGANVWAARQAARTIRGNITTVLPDRAERYFSTALL